MKKSYPKVWIRSSKQSPLVQWTLVIERFLSMCLTSTLNSLKSK